jgi:hypothetical protein
MRDGGIQKIVMPESNPRFGSANPTQKLPKEILISFEVVGDSIVLRDILKDLFKPAHNQVKSANVRWKLNLSILIIFCLILTYGVSMLCCHIIKRFLLMPLDLPSYAYTIKTARAK